MPYDDTYSVLKSVAAGDFVFLDYKNGVGPQIEIKYKSGDKTFIHQASHRWAKHSGKFLQIGSCSVRRQSICTILFLDFLLT